MCYYRKRGSASYIAREVLLVRERERERDTEKERGEEFLNCLFVCLSVCL